MRKNRVRRPISCRGRHRFCAVTLGRKLPRAANCSLVVATQNALKSRSLICVKCSRRLPTCSPSCSSVLSAFRSFPLPLSLSLSLSVCTSVLRPLIRRVRRPAGRPRCITHSRTLKLNSLAPVRMARRTSGFRSRACPYRRTR